MHKLDVDDLARRYQAGEPVSRLADSLGVTSKVIVNRLQKAGIAIRPAREAQRLRRGTPEFVDADVIARYRAGDSELAIAKAFGISRGAVRPILLKAGISPRGNSAAGLLRYVGTTHEDRLKITEAAHAAVRGVPQSEEYRRRVARGREATHSNVGPGEVALRAALESLGIAVAPQKAIGRYNVDLALTESRVAVEVFGGHWHSTGHHAERYRERINRLLDEGWLPIIVWVTKAWPLQQGAIDYIVARHQQRRAAKAFGGKEHMIRGDGKPTAIGKRHLDGDAREVDHEPSDSLGGDDL